VAGNVLLFVGVLYLVVAPSSSSATPSQVAATANPVSSQEVSALDQLASASIAQTVAEMTNVPERTAITNQADTERANLNQASLDDDSLALKPQVIQSAYKSNKDIKLYIVQTDDTIPKIADKFGVTSDSIRWSNNLNGNAVNKGAKLRIPPVNGMVYVVKKGDTAKSLALKYNLSEAKIIQYNDAELHGLKVGEMIILPGASKAAQVAQIATTTVFHRQASYGYNGYDYGYCTWWVANLRMKAGNPLPVGLGNASSWPYWSRVFGLPHGATPRVGAAVVTSTSGEGHVAYVTAVKGPNTVVVSEMNHNGWNVVSTRTLTGDFYYIY
jgi:surface antigen